MSQRAAWSAWIRMVASLLAFAAGCGDVSGSGKTAAPEGGYTTAAIDASNDRAIDGASPTGLSVSFTTQVDWNGLFNTSAPERMLEVVDAAGQVWPNTIPGGGARRFCAFSG